MLLPRGVRLVAESEIGQQQDQQEEAEPVFVENERPEVVIEGVRATSRQLALKEREVHKKMQESRRKAIGKYQTANRQKKTKQTPGAERPQAE